MQIEPFLVTAMSVSVFRHVRILYSFYELGGIRSPVYYAPPIRLEEPSCPRCTSRELEALGHGTIRCRSGGFMFRVGPEFAYDCWVIWPFFWWFQWSGYGRCGGIEWKNRFNAKPDYTLFKFAVIAVSEF